MPLSGEKLIEIFNWIGSLVCHQIQDRTLQIGGVYLPVCARDTGIYLGFLIGYSLLPLRNKRAHGPPNLYVTLAMVLPLIGDVATQISGLRVSTNDIRLVSGLLFGTALSPFLIYLLPIVPLSYKIPIIRSLIPEKVEVDSKISWMNGKTLVFGLILDVAFFIIIRLIGRSGNFIFYWMLSIPIVGSIILHIFILPIFLVISLVSFLFKKWF